MSTPINTQGILICGYNNYFNRLLKRETSVSSYLALPNAYVVGVNQQHENGQLFNFNANDGVDTTHVFDFGWDGQHPDYFVVHDGSNIISRWFVTEAVHLSGNKKFRVSLKRDVLADYYDSILDSPCYIEKGHVGIENPFILNSENLPLNQIKKNEYLLKDLSNIGWYYVYLAKNFVEQDHPITVTVGAPTVFQTLPDDFTFFTTTPHTYEFIGNDNQDFISVESFILRDEYPRLTDIRISDKHIYDGGILSTTRTIGIGINSATLKNRFLEGLETAIDDIPDLRTAVANDLGVNSRYKYEQLLALQNKVVKYNNKYYTCRVSAKGSKKVKGDFSISASIPTAIDNELSKQEYEDVFFYYYPDNYTFGYNVHTFELEVVFELKTEYEKTITLSTNRARTNATYDVVVLPAGRTQIVVAGVAVNSIDSLEVVNAMATQLSDFVYDVQLLPYFPYQNKILIYQYIEFDSDDGNLVQKVAIDNDSAIYLIYVQNPTIKNVALSFNIDVPSDPTDFKVANECDYYRLVSPNFNGQFDFSVTKNQGVDGFRVDMLVQPNIPYIYVRPNFKGLYGADYLDNRGLLCSGDFSLPRVDDKFIDYQLQNKNYQNIFDRSIQNMEVTRKYQRLEQAFSLAAGAGQGAAMGSMYGGSKGAIVGGAISGVAGVADMAISEAMYKENKDFAIDRFNMSLENIQALPYSVTKVNPLTPSNKIFPFIEVYSCTDDEREALRQKIIYDGMTIGAIGHLRDYVGTGFTKGQLIRLESISDDTHLLNIIYDEVKKGVVM